MTHLGEDGGLLGRRDVDPGASSGDSDIGPARGVDPADQPSETGLSRNTVRRYLRDAEAARYGPRALRVCKLDPYTSIWPSASSRRGRDWIPATVLLREIQARGYAGGISQLKAHLAPFKQAAHRPGRAL